MNRAWSGKIGHIGILDLGWAKTVEDLSYIESIEHVGIVRVPDHLYEYVTSIPLQHVGSIQRISQCETEREITGQTRVTGEFLASGDPNTTLVVTGKLVVTPPLESIGFKEIRVWPTNRSP